MTWKSVLEQCKESKAPTKLAIYEALKEGGASETLLDSAKRANKKKLCVLASKYLTYLLQSSRSSKTSRASQPLQPSKEFQSSYLSSTLYPKQLIFEEMNQSTDSNNFNEQNQLETKETKEIKKVGDVNENLLASTVALRTLSFFSCHDTLKNYRLGKVIGKGSYGRIIEACIVNKSSNVKEEDKCMFIIKTNVRNEKEESGMDRDVYFLEALDDAQMDGKRIVPKYVDSFQCPAYLQNPTKKRKTTEEPTEKTIEEKKEEEEEKIKWEMISSSQWNSQFIIMDRWDGNMAELIKEQGYITEMQLWRVFRLAACLGLYNIVHGDLKFENMLYKRIGSTIDRVDIVITDFGFAGILDSKETYRTKMGWIANIKELKCGKGGRTLETCEKATSVPHCTDLQAVNYACALNITQLEAYILLRKEVLQVIIETDEDAEDNSGFEERYIGIFAGINNLNRFPSIFCEGYNDAYVTQYQGFIASTGRRQFMFNFNDLLNESSNEIKMVLK